MTEMKYRVHDWVRFDYSEIGEYIGEDYTDKPLRNDEIVDLLNSQRQWIKERGEIINNLKKENEQLKQFIKSLASPDGRIWLNDGYVYRIDKVLKGDVE